MIANGKCKTKIFLSTKQRLDIFEKLQSGASISNLACEFNVSAVTVRRIRREGRILKNLKNEETQLLQRKVLRKPIYEDLDHRLYQWYLNRRMMGDALTDRLLQEKALDICNEFGSSSTFSASRGWLEKFKKRHNIHLFCKHRRKGSADEEGHDKFITENVSCGDEQGMQEELQDEPQEELQEESQEEGQEELQEEQVKLQEELQEKLQEKMKEEPYKVPEEIKKEPSEEAQKEIKEEPQEEIQEKVQEEPPEDPESILSSEERKKKDLDTLVDIIEQYANNDETILRLGMFLRELLEDKQIPE